MFDKHFFGERVKHFRELRSLTLLELSEKADISHNHLSRIESGKHVPTVEMILKIINALNISYSNLMNNSENEEILINSILDYVKNLTDDEVIFMTKLISRF